MKIALKIVGVLVVIISLFIGGLGVFRSFRDAKDAKEYHEIVAKSQKQLSEYRQQSEQMEEGYEKESLLEIIKAGEDAIIDIPSPGTFTFIGVLMVILTLVVLLSGIFLFVSNPKIANILFTLAILVSIIAIVISPNIDGGVSGGISNRKLGIIVGAAATLSALFPFLLARKKN